MERILSLRGVARIAPRRSNLQKIYENVPKGWRLCKKSFFFGRRNLCQRHSFGTGCVSNSISSRHKSGTVTDQSRVLTQSPSLWDFVVPIKNIGTSRNNFIFSLLLLFSFANAQQQISPSKILEKVRTNYSQMNDASASFTQTVKMRYKPTVQQNSGTVKIKKGNKYRIETDQQTIVTDGNTVWMYNPTSKQVLVDQFKIRSQPFSPDKFLFGLPNDFSASNVVKEKQFFVLMLQPTKTNTTSSFITTLKVWVKPEEWIVEKIELTNKNGTTTFISLSDIQFNKGINDKEFQFTITKEMNVVDLKTLK